MRTVELSELDALRLADVIAGKWAHRVTRLAGADCQVDNPVRTMGGQSKRRAFEVEAAAWARILRQLGADPLPTFDPERLIGDYSRPGERRKYSRFLPHEAGEEALRLKEHVLAMIKDRRS